MAEKNISVSVPSDLYAELGSVPAFHGNINKKIQLDLAIGMFISNDNFFHKKNPGTQ